MWKGIVLPPADDEFVSPPDSRDQAPKTIQDLPGMTALKELVHSRKIGFVEEVDSRTGRHSRFCVAPIPSAEWTVVIVLPKDH
jgi:hypothetical protein